MMILPNVYLHCNLNTRMETAVACETDAPKSGAEVSAPRDLAIRRALNSN